VRISQCERRCLILQDVQPRKRKTSMSLLTPWNRVLEQLIVAHLLKKIARISCNPKASYRVHNTPPLVPIPSQINPIHTFPLYFPMIHSKHHWTLFTFIPSVPRCKIILSKYSLVFHFIIPVSAFQEASAQTFPHQNSEFVSCFSRPLSLIFNFSLYNPIVEDKFEVHAGAPI